MFIFRINFHCNTGLVDVGYNQDYFDKTIDNDNSSAPRNHPSLQPSCSMSIPVQTHPDHSLNHTFSFRGFKWGLNS